MYSFFAKDPEKRDGLSRVRQDLTLRFEDNNTIYLAYVYFLQEDVFATTCLGGLSRSFQKSLFEAVWNIYLSAKCHLLSAHSFDELECVYLMLSLMFTIDLWAHSLRTVDSLYPGDVRPSNPSPDTETLAPIAEVSRAKLSGWKAFHKDVFIPFAEKHILPLLPESDTLNSDSHALMTVNASRPSFQVLTSMKELKSGIKHMLAGSRSLLASSHTEQFEFDERALLNRHPLHSFYPIQDLQSNNSGAAVRQPNDSVNDAHCPQEHHQHDHQQQQPPPSSPSQYSDHQQRGSSICRSAMFQLHLQLSGISWVHTYVASPARRHMASRASHAAVGVVGSPSHASPTSIATTEVTSPQPHDHQLHPDAQHQHHDHQLPQPSSSASMDTNTGDHHHSLHNDSSRPIVLGEIIPPPRLEQIRDSVAMWTRVIQEKANVPEHAMSLCNDFYFRFLLDVLLEDCEQSPLDETVLESPLISSNNFMATLYAAIFEISMTCFGRSHMSANAFPFVLGVVNATHMDLCKLLSSTAKLLSLPPAHLPSRLIQQRVHTAPKQMTAYLAHLEEKIISEYIWRPESLIYRAYTDGTENFFKYIVTNAGPPRRPRMPIQAALTTQGVVEKFTRMYRDPTSSIGTLNWDAHAIFCKLLRIGCTRIRHLCRSIPALSSNGMAICQAELLFSLIATQKLHLLVDRHIDTFVLCSILAISNLTLGSISIFDLLLQHYSQIPNCSDYAVHLIPVSVVSFSSSQSSQSSSSSSSHSHLGHVNGPRTSFVPNSDHQEPERRFISILDFYHSVFVRDLAVLLSKFEKRETLLCQGTPSFGRHSSPTKDRAVREPKSPVMLVEGEHQNHHNDSAEQQNTSTRAVRDPFEGVRRRIDFGECPAPTHHHAAAPPPALAVPARVPYRKRNVLPMIYTPPKVRPILKPSEDEENDLVLLQPPNNNSNINSNSNGNALQPAAPKKKRRSPPPSPSQSTEQSIHKRPRYS